MLVPVSHIVYLLRQLWIETARTFPNKSHMDVGLSSAKATLNIVHFITVRAISLEWKSSFHSRRCELNNSKLTQNWIYPCFSLLLHFCCIWYACCLNSIKIQWTCCCTSFAKVSYIYCGDVSNFQYASKYAKIMQCFWCYQTWKK